MGRLPLWTVAFLLTACAAAESTGGARARARPTRQAVHDEFLSELVVASQVVLRDGLECLQGLDVYGNVVTEECRVAKAE